MTERIDLQMLLQGVLAGYEPRPQQQEMAQAVLSTLEKGGTLIVEAGTGVGKSLAYLVPLIHWLLKSGERKAAVSTYTKALQHQLYEKDLPFLKRTLFPGLTYALCLGSENYLCARRLSQCRMGGLFDQEEVEDLKALLAWKSTTKRGLRAEISVSATLWQKVAREADLCFGKSCTNYQDCFYQEARRKERSSKVLITNHHLFFANIASGYHALPPFTTAVFDEAHEIEDVAAGYLGIEVSNYKVKHLLETLLSPTGKGLLKGLDAVDRRRFLSLSALVVSARGAAEAFFTSILHRLGSMQSASLPSVELTGQLLGQSSGRTMRIEEPGFVEDTLSGPLTLLKEALKALVEETADESQVKELNAVAARCDVLASSIGVVLSLSLEETVYWAQQAGRIVKFAATPVNVADILRHSVFSVYDAVVLTSATLSIAGDFSYIKKRTGVDRCQELTLSSPFDYPRQALVYIARDMPDPRDERYPAVLIERIREIVELYEGKTMVLFTSHGLMNETAGALGGGRDLFLQGEMDNYRLIEGFRDADRAVLFGTRTFWQGVDFPGDELGCVIITRLPFGVPTDPVVEGRMEYLRKQGGDPFYDYQIPRAVITLRQGFGRLIRTATDTGVVAVLDNRILKKSYGRIFLSSLPPAPVTGSLKEVKAFFRRTSRTRTGGSYEEARTGS